jgi:hypothetical protein
MKTEKSGYITKKSLELAAILIKEKQVNKREKREYKIFMNNPFMKGCL